jgi:hypothetical protein
MYEDLVGKKERSCSAVTKNGYDSVLASTPNGHITFFNNEKIVGVLQWHGNSLKFEGNAEESAKVFFDYLGRNLNENLQKQLTNVELERLNKCLPSLKIQVDNPNQVSFNGGSLVFDQPKNG